MTNQSIDSALHKLANRVITTCCSPINISLGLLKGKLGAVIFLLHYSRHYNATKYESYAMELFEYIKDSSMITNNIYEINNNLIDVGIGMNYIVDQEFAISNFDDLLDKVDNFLLAYLDNKNILYLSYNELITIGKYFILRIEASPSSVNHQLHIKLLDRVVELLKIHIMNIPICNPVIIKFLYLSSKLLPDKSIESLLIQQLNNYPNKTDWYRSGIPNWFNTFYIPEDNELLKKITVKEIEEYRHNYLSDNECVDGLASGISGLIVWMNLLSADLPEDRYRDIKNSAIEKILSDVDHYKILRGVSINYGYSGIGLALLSCIDSQCNQWINLL